MNNLLLPLALVALVAGVGVFFAFGNAGGDAEAQDRLIARLDAIDGKLTSLEDDLAARDATIESLRSAVSANRGAGMQRQPETGNLAGMVDAAVERALAERMAAGTPSARSCGPRSATPAWSRRPSPRSRPRARATPRTPTCWSSSATPTCSRSSPATPPAPTPACGR
ncbi:MAG: hypothetical protein ACYTF3_11565 [Planctomycetota bacterium]|jgi:hypothetical protein